MTLETTLESRVRQALAAELPVVLDHAVTRLSLHAQANFCHGSYKEHESVTRIMLANIQSLIKLSRWVDNDPEKEAARKKAELDALLRKVEEEMGGHA